MSPKGRVYKDLVGGRGRSQESIGRLLRTTPTRGSTRRVEVFGGGETGTLWSEDDVQWSRMSSIRGGK